MYTVYDVTFSTQGTFAGQYPTVCRAMEDLKNVGRVGHIYDIRNNEKEPDTKVMLNNRQ